MNRHILGALLLNVTISIPVGLSGQALPAGVTERSVTVLGPVPLAGTLTIPAGKGPFPSVVLVHGSGQGDRDETVGPNKIFRDLAWGLAEQGIAVLRYDKRTMVSATWFVGKPFTVKDETMDDALSALALVRQQPELDRRRTYLLGHSEGGILAPRIAAQDPELAGLIIAAGTTRMHFAEGLERQLEYLQSIAGADSAATRQAIATHYRPSLDKIHAIKPADSANTTLMIGAPAKYYLDLDAYDPAIAMRQVRIPTLVLQGMRDYQVPPDQLDDWLNAVGARSDVAVKRYPALTHFFMAGEGTPRPIEVLTPGHVDVQVITDIVGWIKAH